VEKKGERKETNGEKKKEPKKWKKKVNKIGRKKGKKNKCCEGQVVDNLTPLADVGAGAEAVLQVKILIPIIKLRTTDFGLAFPPMYLFSDEILAAYRAVLGDGDIASPFRVAATALALKYRNALHFDRSKNHLLTVCGRRLYLFRDSPPVPHGQVLGSYPLVEIPLPSTTDDESFYRGAEADLRTPTILDLRNIVSTRSGLIRVL